MGRDLQTKEATCYAVKTALRRDIDLFKETQDFFADRTCEFVFIHF